MQIRRPDTDKYGSDSHSIHQPLNMRVQCRECGVGGRAPKLPIVKPKRLAQIAETFSRLATWCNQSHEKQLCSKIWWIVPIVVSIENHFVVEDSVVLVGVRKRQVGCYCSWREPDSSRWRYIRTSLLWPPTPFLPRISCKANGPETNSWNENGAVNKFLGRKIMASKKICIYRCSLHWSSGG